MDGGFDNWRDQYPVYTKSDGTLKRTEPKDQLDQMVINYKRACLMLDYPDLSPPRPSFKQPRVVTAINGVLPGEMQNQSLKHVPNATVIRAEDVDVQGGKRMETTFSAHDSAVSTSSVKGTPSAPQSSTAASSVTVSPKAGGDGDLSAITSPPPSINQKSTGPVAPTPPAPSRVSPVETLKHDPGVAQPVASGYHPSVSVGPPPSVPPRLPMVDRSNKPNQKVAQTVVAVRHNTMGTGGVISAVFSAMMDVIWSGQYTAIKPQRFLRLFASEVNSCLADGHQHDASEFQLFLLDALHEDTNQVTKRVSFEQNYKGGSQIMNDAKDYKSKSLKFSFSPVNEIFNLQTVSELSCTACGEQSATFEECSLITVELPVHASRTSLHQCLSSHFSQTVVHLKRFSMENGDYAKNTMPVDFDPGRLDLSEYLHANSPEKAMPYRLYAVTNHCGRLNSGHYTALVCHGTTGEWLRFDDESVSTSSASGINTSEAYMLYYKKS
ncbi:ubiquitinyl hydrolase 1 [Teladorsagia circumcincta]|uniref:ubiquitinyl hydrolase 1 n=2 Tax=Teladorsagia circumcincta TaxID=45464 RepID=A0A2G9UKH2_TELCI|nr:ubiquitinyl hydrolase 1 [Teladorsagia circumcincta]